MAQYRYPLELQTSPFAIALNPNETYDHVGVYIYRTLILPITILLSFAASSIETEISYVEVFDADNDRFLLAENTAITGNTEFVIEWDGSGVFEPRVWLGSFVTSITVAFNLPENQVIMEIRPSFNAAPYALAMGAVVGIGLVATGRRK